MESQKHNWKYCQKMNLTKKVTCLAILFVILLLEYIDNLNNRYRFRDHHTIGRITGTSFPAFIVREYKEGKRSFTGDHTDILLIEFREIPSDAFYKSLDSLINEPNSGWSVSENQYSYSIVWGNGFPVPKGENDEDDGFINITLEKGKKLAKISYGSW